MKSKCHVNWFEIFVYDFDRAKNFYGNLFGWEFKILKDYEFGEYWTIFTGFNSPGGGMLKRDDGEYKLQSTRIYVEVEDIDLIIKKSGDFGGMVKQIKKQVSKTSGFFAILYDPEGNEIGLWSAK